MTRPAFLDVDTELIVQEAAKNPPKRIEMEYYSPNEIELMRFSRNLRSTFQCTTQSSADATRHSVMADVVNAMAVGGVLSPV